MNRREFLVGGSSAALLYGCLTMEGTKGLAPHPTTLQLQVGAERPFRILHASDTHISLMNDFDRQDKTRAHYEKTRTECFQMHAREYFVGTFDYARRNGVPLLHTGDLIDYIGEANLAAAREQFVGTDAMVCPGNHEWEYLLRLSDPPVMRPKYYEAVRAAYPNDLTVASRIINGVNFILLDNADYQVPPDRATRVEAEVKRGLPCVLCCHIPFETPDLREAVFEHWHCRRANRTGDCCQPDVCFTAANKANHLEKASPDTWTFLSWLKAQSNVKAVLCGHQHFAFKTHLTPTLPQFLAGGNYVGDCTEIAFS